MPRQHELESFWRLCFERPLKVQGRVFSGLFNAVSDVEALLWLHYGFELGLYPKTEAQVILFSNRSRLVAALETVREAGIERFFPPVLSTFLGELSRSGALFDIRYTDRLSSDLVNTIVLDMLFHEVARACSNPLSSVFSDLLTFGTDDEWHIMMQQDASPDQVLSGTGKEVDLVSAGYFAVLDHMGAMDELLQYCGDELTADRPALRDSQGDQTFLVLGERTRSIHAWRVKLDDPVIQRRFNGLTNKLREQLASDKELRSMGFDSDSLLTVIQTVGARWFGDYSFAPRRRSAA